MLFAFKSSDGIAYVHAEDLAVAIRKYTYSYPIEECTSITPVTSLKPLLDTYSPDPEDQLNALIYAIRTATANINPEIKDQIVEAYCADNVDGKKIIY